MNKQKQIKTTAGHDFHGAGAVTKGQQLLTVNAGVDAADALQEAANLISMGATHAFEIGMGNGSELDDNFAWAAHHALQSAHAIVESVMDALQTAQAKE